MQGGIPNTSRPLAIPAEKGSSDCIKCLLLNDEDPHIVDEVHCLFSIIFAK
jgi:hypothetical protein